MEKINKTKYRFYKYFNAKQQEDYENELNKLRESLCPLEKEYHHWACYDQGDHGTDYSKGKGKFTGKKPSIKA